MKYLLVHLPGELPGVILFSPHFTHRDIAERLGLTSALITGAGFARGIGHVETAGFSTSLNLGPSAVDAAMIQHGFDLTSGEYPVKSSAEVLGGLSPEELAAYVGTKAPARCVHCGDRCVPHNAEARPICSRCAEFFSERALRSHQPISQS